VSGSLSRTYKVLAGAGPHALTVTWHAPVEEPDGSWFCHITFDEEGEPLWRRRAGGVDAVQAFYLGLSMVSATLHAHPAPVCWFEKDDNLGLPVPEAMREDVEARAQRFNARERERELQNEVIRSFENRVGRLTLNRPAALHALNTTMCEIMLETLSLWRDDPAVQAVLIDHSGERGFCAGGDIRMLAESGAGDGAAARRFFFTEYQLNALLFDYPKPVVTIMDGVTMGGGVGLAMPSRYRVATERTNFAMPETGIGLFPDVGGGWHLPRLPGKTGIWLALTGARLRGADCLALGIATHFVESGRIAELKDLLLSAHPREGGDPGVLSSNAAASEKSLDPRLRGDERIKNALRGVESDPGPAPIAAQRADIDRLFAGDSVEAIFADLAADASDWARAQLETLKTKSPQTLKVAFRQLRQGAAMTSFAGEMAVEYRIGARVVQRPDFIEGVEPRQPGGRHRGHAGRDLRPAAGGRRMASFARLRSPQAAPMSAKLGQTSWEEPCKP
jgi:enoyl-CoA hydratase